MNISKILGFVREGRRQLEAPLKRLLMFLITNISLSGVDLIMCSLSAPQVLKRPGSLIDIHNHLSRRSWSGVRSTG